MYDVVKVINEAGKISYQCIADKKESQLMASYKNIAEKDFSSEKTSKHSIAKIIELLTYSSYSQIEQKSILPFYLSTKIHFPYQAFLQSEYFRVLDPPPKIKSSC